MSSCVSLSLFLCFLQFILDLTVLTVDCGLAQWLPVDWSEVRGDELAVCDWLMGETHVKAEIVRECPAEVVRALPRFPPLAVTSLRPPNSLWPFTLLAHSCILLALYPRHRRQRTPDTHHAGSRSTLSDPLPTRPRLCVLRGAPPGRPH